MRARDAAMTALTLWKLFMIRLASILLALCITGAAHAQTPALPYTFPVTVGVASALAIGVNSARKRIEFYNASDTAKIAVCPTVSRTLTPIIVCTVNGAGSITLLPYQSYRVDGVGGNPQVNGAWNAIASAPSSPLTVFEWE
jgi:P2-related tail formation protein